MIKQAIKKLLGLDTSSSVEIDQTGWDNQYNNGRWDYLDNISELAHYSLIVGYCQHFNKQGTLLDVGCGNGVLQQRLSILPYTRYTGIDISRVAIESAQRFSNGCTTFRTADAATFHDDNQYDIIIFNESLYCFDDCIKILAHYEQLLAPDGVIIVSMHVQETSIKHWQAIDQRYQILDKVQICNAENTEWICKAIKPVKPNGLRVTH